MSQSMLTKLMGSVLLTGSLVFATVTPSFALSAPNFEVINQGSTRATEINVSPSSSNDWGDNLLDPDDELDPGNFVYALRGWDLGSCVQDFRVIYEDGTTQYLYGVNICRNNVTIYY
jgi:hypothetical protein